MLEKQQLESQRQLELIKQAKAQKLEQKAIWAKKLSALKFSNGEAKEKMERARKVLSECSHVLNDSRRSGDSFFEDLKHLDSRVKQVMDSLRSLQAKRRQADLDMMTVRQKQIRVARSKEDLEQRFNEMISKRDNLIDEEQRLTKKIQDGYATTKLIADQSSDLIKLRSELEQALTVAQHKSIASKSKLDSLYLEAEDEKQRHSEAVSLRQNDLLNTQQLHDKLWEEVHDIRAEINRKSTESIEIWNRFHMIQPKYVDLPQSSDVISECLSEEKSNVELLERRLREDENLLANFENATSDLNNLGLLSAHEKLTEIVLTANAVTEDAEFTKRQELLRTESNKSILVEVESKRTELLNTRSSCSAIEQQYEEATSSSNDKLVLMTKSLTDQKQRIQESMNEIQHQTQLLEELKQSLKDEQVQIAIRNEELSMELRTKQNIVDELKVELDASSTFSDINSDIEVKNVLQQLDEEFQEMQNKIKEKKKGKSHLSTRRYL